MRILVAECEIDYEGRAVSSLSSGERIIIIKNDSTLLIHTETNLKPINYMPKSDLIEFYPNVVEFNTIIATRRKPREVITIYITNMISDIKLTLKDNENFMLSGSERDLQLRLADNPEEIEEGFKVIDIEFSTPAGAIDIFGQDANGNYVIVEIKRVKGSQAAVSQLKRYYDSLKREYKPLKALLISDGITAPALKTLKKYKFFYKELSAHEAQPGEVES